MTKYFKEVEYKMDKDFLAKLDKAREFAKVPFVINSAYRSPEHNARIGGKPNSSHLRGLAVDIKAKDSRTRYKVLEALIHVDDDKDKSQQVIWTY